MMNEVLKYLELKNFWFKKFLASCDVFLADLKKNPDMSMESLDVLQGNRARLLNIIQKTERKLQAALDNPSMKNFIPNSEQKTKIQYHMREKDSILAQILETDREILSLIEEAKIQTENKMKSLQKGKKAISNYKSSVRYSDNLDKQV